MSQTSDFKASKSVMGVFAATVFFSAALMFLLEPVVGKSLLPWYGGTPAVWNACVLFFQLSLLVGYVYVHLLHQYAALKFQVVIQAVIIALALASLPIRFTPPTGENATIAPISSLLSLLSTSIGLIFFVLSTTAPLMQIWFAAARPASNPYALYIASNAGSLVGLFIYPFVLEAWLPLSSLYRFVGWSVVLLSILFVICGSLAIRSRDWESQAAEPAADTVKSSLSVTMFNRWNWFILSLCPSSMMIGVTTYLSSEIAPIPAIWMLPLALYLLSFMIAFAHPPRWVLTLCSVAYVLFALQLIATQNLLERPDASGVVIHVGLLFFGAIALHGRLSQLRPEIDHLTEFYLWISVGGVCGSVFNTLVAPTVFNWLAEYPLMIVVSLWLLPWPRFSVPSRWQRATKPAVIFIQTAISLLVLLALSWNIYFSKSSQLVLERDRSFFGIFSIIRDSDGITNQMMHGTTSHGIQLMGKGGRMRRMPLTYYFPTGPIGQIFRSIRGSSIAKSVGIVGLGVGTLAAYAEPDQDYTFYEIDPAIVRAARNPNFFTFLDDAEKGGARVQVVIGDARLKLRESADGTFGLLILDAFTSDSIPVHLMTREAIREYLDKLQPNGILAFHISNQYVDLEPVLANIAQELNLVAAIRRDIQRTPEERLRGKSFSVWLVMATAADSLQPILSSGDWHPCSVQPESKIWTDDFSSLMWAMMRSKFVFAK
jgi:SAM-dependent methyltransferase